MVNIDKYTCASLLLPSVLFKAATQLESLSALGVTKADVAFQEKDGESLANRAVVLPFDQIPLHI
jgi:hypothetical protein